MNNIFIYTRVVNIKKLVLCALLFLSFLNHTISAELTGKVYGIDENRQRTPLVRATVSWLDSKIGTFTNDKGEFKIEFPTNKTKLVISYIGYLRDTVSIEKSQKNIEIDLLPELRTEGVTVNAKQASTVLSKSSIVKSETITQRGLQKAACCNLSESFVTNPSVDVNYPDAVTGAKTIQLLGLQGTYVQMLSEKTPGLRGLASTYGLSYVPGPWMESIQVSKGNASVADGYESITGQINLEYKKPLTSDPLFLNFYSNIERTFEGNLISELKINDNISTSFMAHGSILDFHHDDNDDGFLDIPMTKRINLLNRWDFNSGIVVGKLLLNGMYEERRGGQTRFYSDSNADAYGIDVKTQRYNFFYKNGLLLPGDMYHSLAMIVSGSLYKLNSFYGQRVYDGSEVNGYVNVIYLSDIFNDKNRVNFGFSFVYDDYDETFADSNYLRSEKVPGTYFEYTFSGIDKLTIVAGARADFHNIYGTRFTPRFHLRYELAQGTVVRASAGKGFRVANIFAENTGLMASSRKFVIEEKLQPEEAWNYGLNFSSDFEISGVNFTFNAEYYRTNFNNQAIADIDRSTGFVYFHNLHGDSYANSYQVDLRFEPVKRLEITTAYRLNDVKMTINNELVTKPMQSRYKAFVNLAYATELDEWLLDFTAEYNGGGRLPSTASNPTDYQRPSEFSPFAILNAQITKRFDDWDIYIGAENLTDFKQSDPIISAAKPFGQYFDGSMIYAPIMGRNIYLGVRFNVF